MKIPFNRFEFTPEEIGEALKALQSGHVAGAGPRGRAAEQLLSEIHGGADVLLTTSCTHALGAWVCSRVIGFGVWYSGSTLPRDVLSLAG